MLSPVEDNGADHPGRSKIVDDSGTPGKEASMIPSISVEMDETPTRVKRTGRSPSSGGAGAGGGGLNIRGLTLPTAGKITPSSSTDHLETTDRVGELATSPRVAAFKAALLQPSPEIPISPTWQSFDASPSASPARRATSPRVANGPHPSSPSMLFASTANAPSPLGPGPRGNAPRFDPTPNHGIHARNLSLFFPSPGQQRPIGKDVFGQSSGAEEGSQGEELELPAGQERKAFGGKGGWSFAGQNGNEGGRTLSPEHATSSKRRGHHHKHSLSHNFFSFLDPTVTNPSLAASPSPSPRPSTPASTSFPTSVPMPMQNSTSLMSTASSPTLSPLPAKGLDSRAQLYLSFAVMDFIIGAGLWVEGQMSGWRCLAGVGYLTVFDAAGVAIRMIRDGDGWRSTRRPYGTARFMTLLYFAQSLFLVFAAVYIAKESIETVLLGEGAHSHEGGHDHGHGHGHGGEREHSHDEEGIADRPVPRLLLLLSTATALFSGSILDNHSKLVESVGTLFIPSILVNARVPKPFNVLRNPFSMTVSGASAAILLGSLTFPSALLICSTSFHVLDSSLSLLFTMATAALAYPSARSFALVLLQTAPPSSSVQMTALRQSLRSIADDRRILGIGSTRVWMIASTGCDSSDTNTNRDHIRSDSVDSAPSAPASPTVSTFPPPRKASTTDVGNTRLSVSVVVHVNDNVGDRDVLDVTKYVWNRVSAAVGEGEVVISVKRGWEGMETT